MLSHSDILLGGQHGIFLAVLDSSQSVRVLSQTFKGRVLYSNFCPCRKMQSEFTQAEDLSYGIQSLYSRPKIHVHVAGSSFGSW